VRWRCKASHGDRVRSPGETPRGVPGNNCRRRPRQVAAVAAARPSRMRRRGELARLSALRKGPLLDQQQVELGSIPRGDPHNTRARQQARTRVDARRRKHSVSRPDAAPPPGARCAHRGAAGSALRFPARHRTGGRAARAHPAASKRGHEAGHLTQRMARLSKCRGTCQWGRRAMRRALALQRSRLSRLGEGRRDGSSPSIWAVRALRAAGVTATWCFRLGERARRRALGRLLEEANGAGADS